MTPGEGLVVVVPRGFDPAKVPGILERKRSWIERTTRRLEAAHGESEVEALGALPRELDLRCLGLVWKIDYAPGSAGTDARTRTVVRERPGRQLVVHGDKRDAAACRAALRRWLVRKARRTLAPRLAVLACEHGFDLGPVSVRTQRTRWASCSRRAAISINAALLFLPPELVDYVLLHELCHTVRPDHSPAFWDLLSKHDPDCLDKRQRMRNARRSVPRWLDERVA